MTAIDKTVGAVVIAAGAWFVWQIMSAPDGLRCVLNPVGCAEEAGRSVAETVINPAIDWWRIPQTGIVETGSQYVVESIPVTPSGNNPSNVTWDLSDGVKLGIPSGYTPETWCAANPSAPVCASIPHSEKLIPDWVPFFGVF